MEGFPVELIGNILSHVVNVKDVVRVSMTCRKWRLELRYLHTLQQDYLDPPLSNRTQQLEISADGHDLTNMESSKFAYLPRDQIFCDSGDCLALACR
jgi:hypothetical protein